MMQDDEPITVSAEAAKRSSAKVNAWISSAMQQDETRVEVVQGLDTAWAWIDHLPQGDTAQEHLNAIDAAREFLLAFAAPPAGERDMRPALPLIEAIAEWERENGTLAAIMPDEYGDFCRLIADAAVQGSARAVIPHQADREAIAIEQARFLCDRLDDLDWCDLDRTANDFSGHVDPALSRLKSTLESLSPTPSAGRDGSGA